MSIFFEKAIRNEGKKQIRHKKECTVINNALFFIISIPYPGNII